MSRKPRKPAKPSIKRARKPAKPRPSKRARKAARRGLVEQATGVVRRYGAFKVEPPEVTPPLTKAARLRRRAVGQKRWIATVRGTLGRTPTPSELARPGEAIADAKRAIGEARRLGAFRPRRPDRFLNGVLTVKHLAFLVTVPSIRWLPACRATLAPHDSLTSNPRNVECLNCKDWHARGVARHPSAGKGATC